MLILISYLIIINLYGFILMYKDKKYSKTKHWRIPEAKLLSIAFFFGSIGILLGMKIFRHKTKHIKFTFTVPFFIIIQGVLLLYLYNLNY